MSLTLLPNVLQKYRRECFFETGTFQGGGVAVALQVGFERIYSVEISPAHHSYAAQRFQAEIDAGQVTLFLGDSREILAREVPKLAKPTTFWIDAHDDSHNPTPTPLYEEIENVLRAAGGIGEHVILIDDVRLVGKPGTWGEQASLQELMSRTQAIDHTVIFQLEPNRIGNADVLVILKGPASGHFQGVGPDSRQGVTQNTLVTFKSLGKLGRLGNQLFQIAATIGIARRNGFDFVFPPWPYTVCLAKPLPQSATLPPAESYVEQSFAFRDVALSGPTDLVGFFQSEKYFRHCEPEIRKFFMPRPEMVQQMRAAFGYVRDVKTCSIHVRRTDYVGHWKGLFADLAAGDYYERAIACFDADTTFLVFSDDIPWCKQRFQGPRFTFMEGLRDIADLFLMSTCRGHIIANSSFSWWGAWLDPRPSKKVIAPKTWFRGEYADESLPFRAGPLHHGFQDARDLIPEGWTRL